MKFKQYHRKSIAELRPVTESESKSETSLENVAISQVDLNNGSPKLGDMIARNPGNHNDQWLVAAQYFIDNFEEYK
jgi:ABC-type microcin C transport system permease subunit YejE